MNKTQLTILLHWMSALLIISLLISGMYMTGGNSYPLYYWHKSFGVVALLLIAARLVHRYRSPWTSSVQGSNNEKLIKNIHLTLLIFALVMPISGMVMSGFGGYGIPFFEWQLVSKNTTTNGEIVSINENIKSMGTVLHIYIGYTFSALLIAHMGAALWHHIVKKDNTLKRMTSLKELKENQQ